GRSSDGLHALARQRLPHTFGRLHARAIRFRRSQARQRLGFLTAEPRIAGKTVVAVASADPGENRRRLHRHVTVLEADGWHLALGVDGEIVLVLDAVGEAVDFEWSVEPRHGDIRSERTGSWHGAKGRHGASPRDLAYRIESARLDL